MSLLTDDQINAVVLQGHFEGEPNNFGRVARAQLRKVVEEVEALQDMPSNGVVNDVGDFGCRVSQWLKAAKKEITL